MEVNCVWRKVVLETTESTVSTTALGNYFIGPSLELGGLQVSSEVPIGRRARVSSLQRGEELMKQFLDDHKRVMQQWQRLTTGCSGVTT